MRVTAFLLLLLFLAVPSAMTASAPSVDEIVRRHLEAIGGARWNRIESLLIVGSGRFGSMIWAWKKPDKFRTEERESGPGGRALVTMFDGTAAWTSNPFREAPEPRRLTREELQRWRAGLLIRSDLLDLPKEARVTLLATEEVAGNAAYKLSIERPGIDPVFLWIDAKSFLAVQRARTIEAPWGGAQTPVTRLHDYRNIEGLLIPHAVGDTTLVVEVNAELDDASFRPPARSH